MFTTYNIRCFHILKNAFENWQFAEDMDMIEHVVTSNMTQAAQIPRVRQIS